MQLTEIVGCEHKILGVIGSLQFKLASFDNFNIMREIELESLGKDTEPSMLCSSFHLGTDEFVSEIEVNYAEKQIGRLTATLNTGRKQTWGSDWGSGYYPLTERWNFSSMYTLAGLYGSSGTQTIKYIGFIIYKFNECGQL